MDLLIRDIGDTLRKRLAPRAATHGRTPEDEARELLRQALSSAPETASKHIADLAARLFGPQHGIDLDLPPRGDEPEQPPASFDAA